jgi:hypothetical protein
MKHKSCTVEQLDYCAGCGVCVSVRGVMVIILAFQASDPSSILGGRTSFCAVLCGFVGLCVFIYTHVCIEKTNQCLWFVFVSRRSNKCPCIILASRQPWLEQPQKVNE